MDQAQALCVVAVCLTGVAGYRADYQRRTDDGDNVSRESYDPPSREDITAHSLDASQEDVLGDHKDILQAPKDLLNDDLEGFAKHGDDSSESLVTPSRSSVEVPDEQRHETSHDIIEDLEKGSLAQISEAGAPLPESPADGLADVALSYQTRAERERDDHGGGDSHRPEYVYQYEVYDPHTQDVKSAWELRDGDDIQGGYSLVEPDGHTRVVEYTVSKGSGFNAQVKRLPPGVHYR